MSTLRPNASLWRRTRTVVLAGSIALGTILAPAAVATGALASSSDGTEGASGTFAWEGDSLAGATAIVSAGGDDLSMHAEAGRDGAVIGSIPNGTVIALRIDQTDSVVNPDDGTRWWPVAFGGQDGWVSGAYLVNAGGLAPGTTPFAFDGGTLDGATAKVNAVDGLRLRAEPNASAGTLATIPNGSLVDLRINDIDSVLDPDGVTRWWPVSWDGHSGWVSGYFLTSADGSAPTTPAQVTPAAPREPFSWDGDPLEGATAIAAGDGQNVNVRAEPSPDAEVVAKAPDGSVVELRIAMTDSVVGPDGETRWWPVVFDEVEGWISGDFLASGPSASEPGAPGQPGQPGEPGSVSIFPSGSTAIVQTQSGGGVKLRGSAGMDGEQIGSVSERSEVTIVSGPASHENSHNGWFEIEHNGQRGYVDGDLLVLIATPVATATATTEPTATEATQTATATATETPAAGVTETPRATETETPDTTATATATQGATGTATVTSTQPSTETTTPSSTQPPAQSGGSDFILPVPGSVQTQGFGCSSLGFYPYNPDWGCGVHDGIDFAAPSGTPILAVADGTVVTAGWCDCGLGYYVEIDHGNNLHTIYGHMAGQPYVSVGQRVTQGETIGPVGSTGLSTGPHTHFMVQVNGVSQDPGRYLP